MKTPVRNHINPTIVLYEIGQDEVRNGDITRFLRDFRANKKRRGKSRRALYGSVIFRFAYDDHDEEIFEIPEIREYVDLLNREWPCWLFYSVRDTETLRPILLASLESLVTVRNTNTGNIRIKYSPDEMSEVLLEWIGCAEEVAYRASANMKLIDVHLAEWLPRLLSFELATDLND